jgi:hypothetical protein
VDVLYRIREMYTLGERKKIDKTAAYKRVEYDSLYGRKKVFDMYYIIIRGLEILLNSADGRAGTDILLQWFDGRLDELY